MPRLGGLQNADRPYSMKEKMCHLLCYCTQHAIQHETVKRTLVRLLRKNFSELNHFSELWQSRCRTKALDWSMFYNFEILRSIFLLLPFFQMFLIYFILPLIHCFYVLFPQVFFHLLCSPHLTQQAAPFVGLTSSVFIKAFSLSNHLFNITIIIWEAPAQLQLSAHFTEQWPRSALRGSSTTPSLPH